MNREKKLKKELVALISKNLRGEITYDEFDSRLKNMLTEEEYINVSKKPIREILSASESIVSVVKEICK